MNLKQKVLSGLAWSAAGRLIAQLITWSITIIVIRLLSPEDYGLMTLAYVFIQFLSVLNELGLGAAIIQRKNNDDESLRSIFGLALIVGFIFCLALMFSSVFISEFYDEPRLINLIKVLSLQFLFMGFNVLPRSLLQREMKFKRIAAVKMVSEISGSLITLFLALTGYGVWALVWGTLSIRIVSTVAFNVAYPCLYIPRINISKIKPYLSFGGILTLAILARQLYSQSDVLVIGKVLNKELLGYYSVGFMLASLPMEKVSGIITQVAFPSFSIIQSEIELVRVYFLKAVRMMCLVAFPVLWGISSISPEIVLIFLGQKWINAIIPMQIICLVVPLRMVSVLFSNATIGIGRADVLLITYVIPLVLMPIAFYFGSFWNVSGVSYAWLIGFSFVFFLNLTIISKVVGFGFVNVLKNMVWPFLASLFMYLFVYIIKITFIADFNTIIKMLISIVSGSICYFLFILIFNRKVVTEFKMLFNKS